MNDKKAVDEAKQATSKETGDEDFAALQRANNIFKELYNLSNSTLTYITEQSQTNSELCKHIFLIKQIKMMLDCLQNNYQIAAFPFEIIKDICFLTLQIENIITISNPIHDKRSRYDAGKQNKDIIDTTISVPDDGCVMNTFIYYATRVGWPATKAVYATIWRIDKEKYSNAAGLECIDYKLINIFKMAKTTDQENYGVIRFENDGKYGENSNNKDKGCVGLKMELQKGDMIGVRWEGKCPIPRHSTEGYKEKETHWSLNLLPTPEIGEIRQFRVSQMDEEYSYGVEFEY